MNSATVLRSVCLLFTEVRLVRAGAVSSAVDYGPVFCRFARDFAPGKKGCSRHCCANAFCASLNYCENAVSRTSVWERGGGCRRGRVGWVEWSGGIVEDI